MNREEKIQELEKLREQVYQLEKELDQDEQEDQWGRTDFYATFHFLSGMMLGFFGAIVSLLFNVIGSILIKQHPLELIRIYLTFPLGESALSVDSGAILALGCCLYIATGMVYGTVFHIILARFFKKSSVPVRFVAATVMGLVLWGINFYGILSWAQPAFIGGNWILEGIPVWIAVLTHLSFAWTMLVIDAWGQFDREGHIQAA